MQFFVKINLQIIVLQKALSINSQTKQCKITEHLRYRL